MWFGRSSLERGGAGSSKPARHGASCFSYAMASAFRQGPIPLNHELRIQSISRGGRPMTKTTASVLAAVIAGAAVIALAQTQEAAPPQKAPQTTQTATPRPQP